jgi:hypothetical protein
MGPVAAVAFQGSRVGKHPARALGWLDLLAQLMPETVKLEVSSYLLVVALVALWIWRHPPGGGGHGRE